MQETETFRDESGGEAVIQRYSGSSRVSGKSGMQGVWKETARGYSVLSGTPNPSIKEYLDHRMLLSNESYQQDSITSASMAPPDAHLIAALAAADGSTRLKAALAIGSNPEPGLVDTLVARCAIEPDFYVRDMLTWALTRFPPEITVPKLIRELDSEIPQARSQALHTLSKIKDASAFPAITRSLLGDPDDEVARSAWRAGRACACHRHGTASARPERRFRAGHPGGQAAIRAR